MSNIVTPNTFAPSTLAKSSEVNANFAEIQTKFNTYAMQTDVAKIVTVPHAFQVSQAWNAAQAFGAGLTASSATITNLGVGSAPTAAAGIVVTSAGLTGTTQYGVLSTPTFATSATNTGYGLVTRVQTAASVFTMANAYGVFVDTPTLGAGSIVTTAFGLYVASQTVGGTNYAIFTNTGDVSLGDRLVFRPAAGKLVGGATSLSLRNAADSADNLLVTDAGVVTARAGLTVTAGGVTATGNSTITGNLTVTGTFSGGSGLNNFVRRTTDLTGAWAATDLTLSFAIGASEEWEAEWVLFHTNASAATLSLQVTGPASFTYLASSVSTVYANNTATTSDARTGPANLLVGATMSATLATTTVRAYCKGGGTAGTVSLTASVSAGTGTLKAGSFVKYARIA